MNNIELHYEFVKVLNDPYSGQNTARLRELENIAYMQGNLLASALMHELADTWDELEEIKQ